MTPLDAVLRGLCRRSIAALAALACACVLPLCSAGGEVEGAAAAPPKSGGATCQTFRVRPQDEVWAVSTRCLGCPSGSAAVPGWTIWKYDAAGPRWVNASTAEFYQSDSRDVVTPLYVHGNRIDSSLALQDGLSVYFQLVGKFDDERPVRFVIWSWPSEQIRGPLNDVRTKAARSDTEAYYLARFFGGMHREVKTGPIGFSLGARIVGGAAHLLAGGSLCGWTVPVDQRPQMHVAFWAAAEHDYWLAPGYFHGRAVEVADRWLITHNRCDPVLSRYRFIEKRGNPTAMGYSGVAGRNRMPAEWNSRIEEMDVTHLVGGQHIHDPYLYNSPILDRTRAVVLWSEASDAPGERGASAP
jgi:hypothetical protein